MGVHDELRLARLARQPNSTSIESKRRRSSNPACRGWSGRNRTRPHRGTGAVMIY